MRGLLRTKGHAWESGSTLVEFMAALTIMSLLLMPLTGSVLRLRERVIESWRTSLEDASPTGAAASPHQRLWRWSDVQITATNARPDGMEVFVRGGSPGRDREIAWWLDGWPAGRSAVDDAGTARVSLLETVAVNSAVLTIRARQQGGGWGVPWRVRWGSVTGIAPTEPALDAASPSIADAETGGAVVVVHMKIPGQGVLDPGDARPAGPVTGGGDAVTLFVPPGDARLSCDGGTQSISSEPGSLTHVFF